MEFKRKLPIPQEIKKQYSITDEEVKIKEERDKELCDIFSGRSSKFLLIIGPCSADYPESVLDYIGRLREIQDIDKVKEKIMIVPRIYTNKPRTNGSGYKGMLHQPNPEEHPDMLTGIIAIRDIHLRALREYGFTCADEMLYPENYRYLSDLLSYVAIGARSVENQQHRLTASGLDIPVGMKNPTSGDISIMMNAIMAAQHSHTFLYRGWEVKSEGNPYAHAIMRGFTDMDGKNHSNYHYEDLVALYNKYEDMGLKYPAVVVDTNHANSGKAYLEQPRIAKDVIYSRNHNEKLKTMIKGLMIESYIEDGCQSIGCEHVYGKSITDPCIGWEKTEKLILDIADSL